jgi:eukaryotic-like serine/threonine-protein kinase
MENTTQADGRVMTLVDLALALDEGERETFLRHACSGDSSLFDQVWNHIQWEHRMRDFLLEPLRPSTADDPFVPGQILVERFVIIREVARGGMGIVWEAFDNTLNRRVAIKCARFGFDQWLRPEVSNATQIAHPNVCRIFEIHTASTEHGAVEFISMEFLAGETLSARLRRAPMALKEARTVSRQLCAGLAEAHRNHVIHGDLKSNNVILTTGPDGSLRAVITDFGLAR